MTIHPVLAELQAAVPQLTVHPSGLSALLWGAGDLRHVLYTHKLSFIGKEGYSATLRSTVTLRYPITVRNELYARALEAEVKEHLDVSEVFIVKPSGIGFVIEFDEDHFGDCEDPEDVADELWGQISGATNILATVCRIGNLNYRLQDRGGTEQYRRLMPTLLAKLTICGHDSLPS